MSALILDAPLLACPDPMKYDEESFEEIFHAFLARLSDLQTLRSNLKSATFYRNSYLALQLAENESYPFRHSIQKAFDYLRSPSDFQIEDIIVLSSALLERSVILQEMCLIDDVVVSNYSLENDPVQSRDDVLSSQLCRTLVVALSALGTDGKFDQNTFLASHDCVHSPLRASFDVDVTQLSNGELITTEDHRKVSIANYRGISDFVQEINLELLWGRNSSDSMLDAVLLKCARDANLSVEELREKLDIISINDAFFFTAKKLGFLHEPTKISMLIRVCADIVLGRNQAHTHKLRTSAAATAPQHARGDWRGWRHDIDYEFHLHYWKLGSAIELASIGPHNCFDIAS